MVSILILIVIVFGFHVITGRYVKFVIGVGDDAIVQESARWLFLDAANLVTMIILSNDLIIIFLIRFKKTVNIALGILILCCHTHGSADIP